MSKIKDSMKSVGWVRSERGLVAIAMVIIIVAVLLTLAGGLTLLTSTGYRSYHFSKDRSQALCLAEAGISQALREIKGNTDYDEDGGVGSISDDGDDLNNPTLTYSDGSSAGSYWVECSQYLRYREDGSPYYAYSLISTGVLNQVSRIVTVTYNQDLSFSEFSSEVVYSTSYEQDQGCNIGEVAQVAVLPVPDLDFFHNNADHVYENGLVVGEGQTLAGVYYVKGNAYLDQGVTLRGSIIVESGSLIIDRNCTIDPSQNPDETKQNYPAVVVAGDNAELNIDQSCTISGLVYSSGDVYVDQGNVIMGALVGDNITIDQGVTIALEGSISAPGFMGAGPAEISLESGSWQST